MVIKSHFLYSYGARVRARMAEGSLWIEGLSRALRAGRRNLSGRARVYAHAHAHAHAHAMHADCKGFSDRVLL